MAGNADKTVRENHFLSRFSSFRLFISCPAADAWGILTYDGRKGRKRESGGATCGELLLLSDLEESYNR